MERRAEGEQNRLIELLEARTKLYLDVHSLHEEGIYVTIGMVRGQVPEETVQHFYGRFGKSIKERVGNHIEKFVKPFLNDELTELEIGGTYYLDLENKQLYGAKREERSRDSTSNFLKSPVEDNTWFLGWTEIIAAVNSLPIY